MIGNQDHHEDEWPKQDNNSIPSSNNSETTSKHSECYRKIPLFLFIMAYISFCCLGALCLTLLERPTERVERLRLHASQINFLRTNPCVSSEELQKFVSYIVSATKMGISMTPIKNISKYDLLSIPENWHENFYSETNIEVNAQLESIARRILTEEEMNNSSWNFYESVFFVITVITTIGYGTISPVTIYGKAFCIFLVTVGIPMNVILVSVLASLCMPVIRKSRNALVNFYSYSSGHDTHNNKHNKNSKHSNFNFFNERRKFMEDANLRLNNENHNRVSKLFFKLKSLFGRHINAPDKRCESSVLHRSLSDSRLSNSIVKNNPRSTVCNITDPKNVTEGEELSNKTASLTSLSTSLSTNKIQSQSSLAIKTGDYPNDFNGGENDLDISKREQSNKPILSIMKHNELHLNNDISMNPSLATVKINRPKTVLDNANLPKKLTHRVSLSFTANNHSDSVDPRIDQLDTIRSSPGRFSGCIEKEAYVKNVNKPARHSLSELFREVTQNTRNPNDCFSTETSLADRAHVSCIAFLHYLLSRSDLALTTQVKLSQFRYVNVHHVITCSILIPGIIFTYLEQNWTYFDAIYFCIISLSAVGFGDMVASESKDSNVSSIVTILYVKNIYRVMTAIYLVLGTTLIAVLVRSFQEIIDYEFLNVTGGYYDEKFGEHIAQNPCSELFFDDTTPSQNRKSQLKHRDIG
ncbi:unnamed protein product [Schistosoma rodhaini]|uniref:Potassium channel domain-containing protein n=2 Tax=Schistosoma rodhaini TaxID=6188 RepID=A0AA85EQV7_9TREM|nr:unnamed protein product [Schistosoma rodhaini]CAH8682183.1 unnamed protein product [Schistosoma rodhaini]